jgi:hypothetical protein
MDSLIDLITHRKPIPAALINPRNIFIALIEMSIGDVSFEIMMDTIIVFIDSFPFVFHEADFNNAVVSIMGGVYGDVVDDAIIRVKSTIMESLKEPTKISHDGVLSKFMENSISVLLAGRTPNRNILGAAIIRDLGCDILDDKLSAVMNELTSSEILAKYFMKDETIAKIIIDNLIERKDQEALRYKAFLDSYKTLFDKMLKVNNKLTKIISGSSARPHTPTGKGEAYIEDKLNNKHISQGESSNNY